MCKIRHFNCSVQNLACPVAQCQFQPPIHFLKHSLLVLRCVSLAINSCANPVTTDSCVMGRLWSHLAVCCFHILPGSFLEFLFHYVGLFSLFSPQVTRSKLCRKGSKLFQLLESFCFFHVLEEACLYLSDQCFTMFSWASAIYFTEKYSAVYLFPLQSSWNFLLFYPLFSVSWFQLYIISDKQLKRKSL